MAMKADSAKLQTVRVADITEYPTELGNRCLLLREKGLEPYWHTEEEIMDALMESAGKPECLHICQKSSRCSAFYERFEQGVTPFIERDPICLLEYGGRYWASEGKHRICLAKRAGIERIEAYVYPMAKDSFTLLPPVGTPGVYNFLAKYDKKRRAYGEVAVLWIGGTVGVPPSRVTVSPAFLDAAHATYGNTAQILPGLSYCVSFTEERPGLLRRRGDIHAEATVTIELSHRNTRIWLLSVPAGMAVPPRQDDRRAAISQGTTIYRTGCWRNRHLTTVVSELY